MNQLPDLAHFIRSDDIPRLPQRLLLDSVTSPESKRAYSKGISDFLAWYKSSAAGAGFNKASVQAHKTFLVNSGLSSSTVNVRMSAIRRLAAEASDNGLMDSNLASDIGRVKGIKQCRKTDDIDKLNLLTLELPL